MVEDIKNTDKKIMKRLATRLRGHRSIMRGRERFRTGLAKLFIGPTAWITGGYRRFTGSLFFQFGFAEKDIGEENVHFQATFRQLPAFAFDKTGFDNYYLKATRMIYNVPKSRWRFLVYGLMGFHYASTMLLRTASFALGLVTYPIIRVAEALIFGIPNWATSRLLKRALKKASDRYGGSDRKVERFTQLLVQQDVYAEVLALIDRHAEEYAIRKNQGPQGFVKLEMDHYNNFVSEVDGILKNVLRGYDGIIGVDLRNAITSYSATSKRDKDNKTSRNMNRKRMRKIISGQAFRINERILRDFIFPEMLKKFSFEEFMRVIRDTVQRNPFARGMLPIIKEKKFMTRMKRQYDNPPGTFVDNEHVAVIEELQNEAGIAIDSTRPGPKKTSPPRSPTRRREPSPVANAPTHTVVEAPQLTTQALLIKNMQSQAQYPQRREQDLADSSHSSAESDLSSDNGVEQSGTVGVDDVTDYIAQTVNSAAQWVGSSFQAVGNTMWWALGYSQQTPQEAPLSPPDENLSDDDESAPLLQSRK